MDIDLNWLPPKEDEVLEDPGPGDDAEVQRIHDSSSSSSSEHLPKVVSLLSYPHVGQKSLL